MEKVKEIMCSSAAVKIDSRYLPFVWDMNPYRGCVHGCKYCYAIYSHDYIKNGGKYFDDIYVKVNIAEKLEEQLNKASWKKEVINIGGVSDCYQKAEGKYEIMPQLLKILIKYKNPCIISTKSELILRDFELIDELSRLTYVNIAFTVTCVDRNLESKLEPKASAGFRRFEVLKEFSKTNAVRGIHMMPLIPYLTDSFENIEAIYCKSAESGADYILPGMLNLRGKTKDYFTDFMKSEFSSKIDNIVKYFVDPHVKKERKREVFKRIDYCSQKYGMSSVYKKFQPEIGRKETAVQLSLLDMEKNCD